MVPDLEPLPGMKHMLSVLKAHGVGADLDPPNPAAPRAGDLLLGEPFDPVLAKIYSRFDGGRFGDLILIPTLSSEGGLVSDNERDREYTEPRVQKLFRFARVWLLPYELATVPSLADADGIQPVVYLTSSLDKVIQPVASDADRALGVYAVFLDRVLQASHSLWGATGINFPYSVLDVIAQDEKLVRMLEEGRFEELVAPDPTSRQWVDKVLAAARAR